MLKPGYWAFIQWIADNDESAETDPVALSELVTVTMVADLFVKDPLEIAKAVLRLRKRDSQ